MLKVTLKNGSIKEVNKGTTLFEIVKSLGGDLYKNVCVAKIDGELRDLKSQIDKDCKIEFLTFDSEEGKKTYWHTTAHILAQAMVRLFPKTKVATGPAIERGFYYDFDLEDSITPEVLEKLEAEMAKIIKEDLPVEIMEVSPEEALKLMEEKNQPYKIELIKKHANDNKIIFRKQGEFIDFCNGTHLMSTGMVGAVKLTNFAGAYWLGDSKNKMLQRVYGISFETPKELKEYLHMIEEAKKRDHRKLGKELELFTFMEEGPGFPFFLPKGCVLREQLESYWRDVHKKAGYQEIRTPIILNDELWHRSGHWEHYKDNMYITTIDDRGFAVKPMNCPCAILVYKSRPRSYNEFPLKYAEMGLVQRHEQSGNLHGLMRVRCFTQDEAHIFMTPEQIKEQVGEVIDLIDEVYKKMGFKYTIELSTRPENSMGSNEDWENATNALADALNSKNVNFKINEGDGAFYGPKIDFHLEDCLKRTWQCGTVQLDFQMPERFDLEYIGQDSQKHRPVMVHRVILGSIERFIGILTEHTAANFPTWLSPEQVRILPISDAFLENAKNLEKELKKLGISRISVDSRNEKIGYKIREAQVNKVPYMVIIGAKEAESGEISVRSRSEGDLGSMSTENFVTRLLKEIENKE